MKLAQAHGAQVITSQQVTEWHVKPQGLHEAGVRLTLSSGQVVEAATAVFAAGPWMSNLVPELKVCI